MTYSHESGKTDPSKEMRYTSYNSIKKINAPHDVFISYASANKVVADAACAKLESKHIRCWIAPRDIIAGNEYGEAIIDAIAESCAVVLIFSAYANESPQVRREIERAISKGKSIVTFRIEDVEPKKAMEYALCNTHWLDALTPPLEKHLEKLARDVLALIKEPYSNHAQGGEFSCSALCDTLCLGYRTSAIEWGLIMKEKALLAGQYDLVGICDRMMKFQWIRSRKLFTNLNLDCPTDEKNYKVFIERIPDEILARSIHEHTSFLVGRVIGATYFGSINQTLALVHTKNKIDPVSFILPMEALDRISHELLNFDPPFTNEVLFPIKTLWQELLTNAKQGRSQIDTAERRMDIAMEEVCKLINSNKLCHY